MEIPHKGKNLNCSRQQTTVLTQSNRIKLLSHTHILIFTYFATYFASVAIQEPIAPYWLTFRRCRKCCKCTNTWRWSSWKSHPNSNHLNMLSTTVIKNSDSDNTIWFNDTQSVKYFNNLHICNQENQCLWETLCWYCWRLVSVFHMLHLLYFLHTVLVDIIKESRQLLIK